MAQAKSAKQSLIEKYPQIKELIDKRTLNAKHFDKQDGSFVMHAHAGHIHYFDKLDSKRFREIDWTLNWNDIKKGWYFNYHSFRPFLPEYADDWVEFRDLFEDKDQTIKYKAVASHVRGRLVQPKDIGLENETSLNCVIYDDAFGKGFDYILYFTRSSLKKVIRVRDGFKPKTDINFVFEVDFPRDKIGKELKIIRALNKEDKNVYELTLASLKEFDTNKQTLIGNDKKDGKEWFTYLRGFKVWDSGGIEQNVETIKVDYFIKDGKKYLRKKLTKAFLDKSVGDVFTDTITDYYSGAGDGYVRTGATYPAGSWDAAHDATYGEYVDYNAITVPVYAGFNNNNQGTIWRGFVPIDTSALPDNAIISSCSLFIYVTGTRDDDNDGYDYINVVQTDQPSNTSLTVDDYNNCGATNNPTTGAGNKDITNISISAYTELIFNSTGISWINLTGYTKLGIRTGHDIEDVPLNVGYPKYDNVTFYSSNNGSNEPYLEVTYTAGATTYTVTTQAKGRIEQSGVSETLQAKGRIEQAGVIKTIQAKADIKKTGVIKTIQAKADIKYADRVSYYHFDASDNGPTDPNGVWSDDSYAFDSDIVSSAISTTGGDINSNYLLGGGTNADIKQTTISKVECRIASSVDNSNDSIVAKIYTDGLGELLATISETSLGWSYTLWESLDIPSGGWTWEKVQALEAKIYYDKISGTQGFISIIELRVYHRYNYGLSTIQGLASIVSVGKVTLDAPSSGSSQTLPFYLEWYIPTNRWGSPLNFHLQIDKTSDSFGDLELEKKSWEDLEFEYWDGINWTAVPATGVPFSKVGNLCRLQITSLTQGTKYWRVKAYAG